MTTEIKLCNLEKDLKKLLLVYQLILIIGVTLGLFYVLNTSNYKAEGIVERYKGPEKIEDEFMTQEYSGKNVNELLMTTHNHILGMSFIFISCSLMLYFNSTIGRKLKLFFIIEPFISLVLTFGSLWLIKYINRDFLYLTIISSIIMYSTFFIMSALNIYDLLKKENRVV